MDEEAFFTGIWSATMIALLTVLAYRTILGDWTGFKETSLAASAWCSLSAAGLMMLRWSGMNLFEE